MSYNRLERNVYYSSVEIHRVCVYMSMCVCVMCSKTKQYIMIVTENLPNSHRQFSYDIKSIEFVYFLCTLLLCILLLFFMYFHTLFTSVY